MKNSEKREIWEARAGRFAVSGKTQTQWCNERGLNVHALKYWRRMLGVAVPTASYAEGMTMDSASRNTGFVPLVVVDAPMAQGALDVVIGKATFKVKPGFYSAFLSEVVRAVSAAC